MSDLEAFELAIRRAADEQSDEKCVVAAFTAVFEAGQAGKLTLEEVLGKLDELHREL